METYESKIIDLNKHAFTSSIEIYFFLHLAQLNKILHSFRMNRSLLLYFIFKVSWLPVRLFDVQRCVSNHVLV